MLKSRSKNHLIATCIAASVSLSACQNMSMQSQGCLAGGAAGAALGTLAGGNDGRNAIAGFLIGCLVGADYGRWVEQEKAKYANAQQFYTAQIAEIMQYNAALDQYNAAMEGEIDDLDRRSSELEKQYRAKAASRDDMRKARAELESRKKKSDAVLSEAEQRLAMKQAVLDNMKKSGGGSADVASLQAEIQRLSSLIDKLRGQTTRLGQLSSRVRL